MLVGSDCRDCSQEDSVWPGRRVPYYTSLLRKDHAEKRSSEPKQEALPPEPPVVPQLAEPPAAESTGPMPAPRMDGPEEDRETLVFHLTRTQAAVAAGVVIAAILVIALIAGRSGKSAGRATGTDSSEGDAQQPLALLLPEPGSDPKPDGPVKVTPDGQKEMAPARAADDAEPAGEVAKPASQCAKAVALAKGDSRKGGLNYLVIQIIPERPDMQEHVAAVRKFLASRDIKTIEVPGDTGGIWVISEEGFNLKDANDRKKSEQLIEAVKKAGKEYATAKYAGRYDFRAPFLKYQGR